MSPRVPTIIFCAQMSRIEQRQLWDTHLPATCLKCVQSVSMCHYQIGHTYFTGEMKVFHILVTSALCWCATHQNLKDIARGKRLSTLCTHFDSSCDHTLVYAGVFECVCLWGVYFVDEGTWGRMSVQLSKCPWKDIWSKKHAKPPVKWRDLNV